ncbi:hypothetical protein EDB85DRAFT_1949564 [Lactarius pseudohatsudake]|nr:hypothetical protein EDB85DRAFT_1949564 [Lactarius pseudohatsudake]
MCGAQSSPPSHASPHSSCAFLRLTLPTILRPLPAPSALQPFSVPITPPLALFLSLCGHLAPPLPPRSSSLLSPCPTDPPNRRMREEILTVVSLPAHASAIPLCRFLPTIPTLFPHAPSPPSRVRCERRRRFPNLSTLQISRPFFVSPPSPALPPRHHVRGNRCLSSPHLPTTTAISRPSPLTTFTFSCIAPLSHLPGPPPSWPGGFGVLPPPRRLRLLAAVSLPCSLSHHHPPLSLPSKYTISTLSLPARLCVSSFLPSHTILGVLFPPAAPSALSSSSSSSRPLVITPLPSLLSHRRDIFCLRPLPTSSGCSAHLLLTLVAVSSPSTHSSRPLPFFATISPSCTRHSLPAIVS